MEQGVPGVRDVETGWLGRHLASKPPMKPNAEAIADSLARFFSSSPSIFCSYSATVLSPSLPSATAACLSKSGRRDAPWTMDLMSSVERLSPIRARPMQM